MHDHYLGIMRGTMDFGEHFEVPFAEILELKTYPGFEVVLLGSNNNEHNMYRGRRVFIKRDSIFLPEEKFEIYGSNDYLFPDVDVDVSLFQSDLEKLLDGVDINSQRSVIEDHGEDSFLYGVSTIDIRNGNVFFLRLAR